jgi:ABC-type uncharacterized transport system auxiliary subunit
MTPEQEQIKALETQVKVLTQFMRNFENAGQVSPQTASTIRKIAGTTTLVDLSDVNLTTPSNGEVLKYNGTQWYNGTDNT